MHVSIQNNCPQLLDIKKHVHLCIWGVVPSGNLGTKDSKDSTLRTQERGFSQGFERTAQGSFPSEQWDGSAACDIFQEKDSLKILKC